jgi:membrane-bound metal-dependent hydrolase YbcI (DUF457 family)
MAGAIVAWTAERLPPAWRPVPKATAGLLFVAAGLAVLPDLDLVYMPIHRRGSHSITAVCLMLILAAGVTRWVTGRVRWGLAALCAGAYGSHLVLDWLGQDLNTPQGIQMLWPLSDEWFLSGWDVFRSTERASPFSLRAIQHNAITAIQEIALLGSILFALWITRDRSN